jgi:hypothetical protein
MGFLSKTLIQSLDICVRKTQGTCQDRVGMIFLDVNVHCEILKGNVKMEGTSWRSWPWTCQLSLRSLMRVAGGDRW